MNQLFKVLCIAILFISCKQEVNSKQNSSSFVEKQNKNVTDKQTIQEFLNILKKDVKEHKVDEIVNKIKKPFEFSVAGETDYIYDIKGLINQSSNFNKIIDSEFYQENNGIYEILYRKEIENTKEDPEGAFSISFYAKRYENSFKLVSMEMPY